MKTKWCLVVLVGLLLMPTVQAAGIWDGEAGDGLWKTPLNWDDNNVPTSSVNVLFQGVGGPCLIDSTTAAVANIVRINNSGFPIASTLNMTGGTLNALRMFVGDSSGMTSPSLFNLSGGAVTLSSTSTNGFVVASVSGSRGTVTASGTSTITSGHNVLIGSGGIGKMYLYGSAQVKATGTGPIDVGSGATGNGYLEINDNALLEGGSGSSIVIGRNGTGNAVINGGTLKTGNQFYTAFASGTTGNLTINSGLVEFKGIGYLGSTGSSTILINGGALKGTGDQNINLGRYGVASNCTVIINNGGSFEGSLAINIGYEGAGSITVNSGGILKTTSTTTSNRNINLGYVAGSYGELIVDGGYVEAADTINIGLAGTAYANFKNNGILRFYDLNVKAIANTVLIDGYFTFQGSSALSSSGWATVRDKIIGYINAGYIAKQGGGTLLYTVNNTPGQYAINFIPEPATLAILGLGSLALFARRR